MENNHTFNLWHENSGCGHKLWLFSCFRFQPLNAMMKWGVFSFIVSFVSAHCKLKYSFVTEITNRNSKQMNWLKKQKPSRSKVLKHEKTNVCNVYWILISMYDLCKQTNHIESLKQIKLFGYRAFNSKASKCQNFLIDFRKSKSSISIRVLILQHQIAEFRVGESIDGCFENYCVARVSHSSFHRMECQKCLSDEKQSINLQQRTTEWIAIATKPRMPWLKWRLM